MGDAVEKFAFYVIGIIFANVVVGNPRDISTWFQLFFVLILWNKRMIFRVSLSGKPQHYSLNKRFQLVENVRVLTVGQSETKIVFFVALQKHGLDRFRLDSSCLFSFSLHGFLRLEPAWSDDVRAAKEQVNHLL